MTGAQHAAAAAALAALNEQLARRAECTAMPGSRVAEYKAKITEYETRHAEFAAQNHEPIAWITGLGAVVAAYRAMLSAALLLDVEDDEPGRPAGRAPANRARRADAGPNDGPTPAEPTGSGARKKARVAAALAEKAGMAFHSGKPNPSKAAQPSKADGLKIVAEARPGRKRKGN